MRFHLVSNSLPVGILLLCAAIGSSQVRKLAPVNPAAQPFDPTLEKLPPEFKGHHRPKLFLVDPIGLAETTLRVQRMMGKLSIKLRVLPGVSGGSRGLADEITTESIDEPRND